MTTKPSAGHDRHAALGASQVPVLVVTIVIWTAVFLLFAIGMMLGVYPTAPRALATGYAIYTVPVLDLCAINFWASRGNSSAMLRNLVSWTRYISFSSWWFAGLWSLITFLHPAPAVFFLCALITIQMMTLNSFSMVQMGALMASVAGQVVTTYFAVYGRQDPQELWRSYVVGIGAFVLLGAAIAYVTGRVTSQKKHLRRMREEVRSHARELEVMSAQKTAFFQNMSHELRTPLTLILAPLEREHEQASTNSNIAVALKNGRRLLRLVNQLLDFQKIEAGQRSLELEPTNLVTFARICGDYFASACSTKRIEFTVTLDGHPISPDDEVTIEAETDALEKVSFNYLSNALKYTPAGGHIELGLETSSDGEFVELFVRDSGPGIAESDQAKLFKLFSQVESSTTREFEGTGLGLALVKSLVERMHGRVGVESVVERGSKFFARFPVLHGRRPSAVLSTVQHRMSTRFEVRPWVLATDGATGVVDDTADSDDGDDGCASIEPGEPRGDTVLVVDDLDDLRELVASMLEGRGYRVMRAANGEHALRLLRKRLPDLVVTDWMMPKLSGVELIARLREDVHTSGIPVILLTAKSDEESKVLGAEVGADVFLGKPFNEQELVSTVRNLLALKSKEREVRALNRHITESILKRYVPPHLVEDALSGRWTMDERPRMRRVTVLFADLVGFTSASETLGTEDIAECLNEHLAAMTSVVFEHGGTIDKFIGDAVMVMFGAPHPMDEQAQAVAAVRCGLAMHRRREELSARAKSETVRTFCMRIGIHQGDALVGNFGSAQRVDFTAIGPTVNLASRIESACEPGAVFLSEETALQLDSSVATAPVGEFELKGIQKKIKLARVLN